jgi:hypothetical protein
MKRTQEVSLGSEEHHSHVLHVFKQMHAAIHQVQQTLVDKSVLVFDDAYDTLLHRHCYWHLVHFI